MKTKIEFYSVLREITELSEVDMELTEGSTVADLLKSLYRIYPKLKAWDSKLLIAANLDYVERLHVIRPNEVISIMPPVQGG